MLDKQTPNKVLVIANWR